MVTNNGVRLLAGALRGRRIDVPKQASLRPTPGMLRETLFNWLQGHVEGACGLDVCAGSGALGFEALSRGAASMTFIERSREAIAAMETNAARFALSNATMLCGDARGVLDRLAAQHMRYDLVYLDPPFDNPQLLAQLVDRLLSAHLISPGGWLYVERPVREAALSQPGLRLHRQSRCGLSQGSLYMVDKDDMVDEVCS